ncbi:MAG: hypothetical protein R3328_00230 [Planococcaceae bacterium]|nr:hypothetical protein [Planococcaceae bacterium]
MNVEQTNKKRLKQKRSSLVNELNKLEIGNCHSCPNRYSYASVDPVDICGECPAFQELRKVGDELEKVAFDLRTNDLPTELNITTYRKLRQLEWTKDEIRIRYKLNKNEFKAFLDFNNERTKKGACV